MQMTNSIEIGNMQYAPNYALSFDGVDDYIPNPVPKISKPNTVEIRFSTTADITSKNCLAWIWGDGLIIKLTGNNTIEVYTGDYQQTLTLNNFTNGNIHTISRTDDGTNLDFYFDGDFIAQYPSLSYGSNYGYFCANYNGNRAWFEGDLHEIRIWDDIRTQTEIEDNINKKLTGNETGLVAYYKMDKGTGNTLIDYAGNNDGNIIGATWQEVE